MKLVILDANENSQEPQLKVQLEVSLKHQVVVAGLGAGDLMVQLDNGELCGFERKRLPDDLVASIADGRLFRQAEVLPRTVRFAFLVGVGELRFSANELLMAVRPRLGLTETGWRKSAVEAAIVRAQLMGMVWVQCLSYADQVRRLVELCESVDRVRLNRRRLVVNPFEPMREKVDFLAQLPGVGVERARALLEAYPDRSLFEVLRLAAMPEGKRVRLWGRQTHGGVARFLGLGSTDDADGTD